MIGDYFSKMATAEKMSPQQLNQSVKDGVLTQDMAQNVMPTPAQPGIQGLQQPPIAQQVMQQADQMIAPEQIKQKINELKDVIAQVYQGVQSGEIEAYKGIPYIKEQLDKIQELQAQLPKQGIDTAPQLAQAAPQEAPQQAPQGIDTAPSNLPTQMAGGGIVAFADNKNQPVSATMPSGPTDYSDYIAPTDYDPVEEYRKTRQLGQENVLARAYGKPTQSVTAAGIKTPYDPALEYYRSQRQSVPVTAPAYGEFNKGIDALENRRASWLSGGVDPYSQTSPVGSVPNMLGTQEPIIPKGTTEEKPPIIIHDDKKSGDNINAPQVDVTAKKMDTFDEVFSKKDKDREDLKAMILGDEGERAKDSKRDMWLEALKASFKLMGGTSPYAAANLGAAGESLATGISGVLSHQDEEKQKRIGQLVALGLKGSELDTELAKLGIDRAEYEAKKPLYKAQADYYSRRTSGSGTAGMGSVPGNVVQSELDRLEGYRANPKSAPFFTSLPLDVQTALLKTDPKSDSYQRAMEKFSEKAAAYANSRLSTMRSYGAKQSIASSNELP